MAYTTIDNPELYFQVKTYTGTGSSQAITLDGSEDMAPDFIWFKNRTSGQSHCLVDAVRGRKGLFSDDTTAELTFDATKDFTSFDSDGFTVGIPHQANSFNYNTGSIVAWCWKESATSGFDIVSFTGNATDDRDISHSLSAVPHFWVTKNTPDTDSWVTYHHKNTSAPETDFLLVDSTQATTDNAIVWSSEAPTSSVYTVGNYNSINGNTDAIITYLWRSVQGYSKFGSYEGNGNADGPFVYTGFKPAFILGKNTTDAGNHWFIIDAARSPYNGDSKWLKADDSSAELTNLVNPDFFSNGFKIRSSDAIYNTSGSTFIYMAFAEAPLVNSNGVPCNAR